MAYLGEDVPKLGFGLMRLPHVDGKMENPVDIEQVEQMVDLFLESGFQYFDTAYVYGDSEEVTKKALVDRHPRESFLLATKLPGSALESREKMEEVFNEQLERTGAGYFDFYLLHGIDAGSREMFENSEAWEFIAEKKAAGLVRHIGFSFHDHASALEEILAKHPEAEFVQLQINYADWGDPVVESRNCYDTARKFGVPIVVMEPLRGGKLVGLPDEIGADLKKCRPDAPIASWGLRFVLGLDGILSVLSGMSSLEQMKENIEIVTGKYGKAFGDKEHEAVTKAQLALAKIPHIRCTDCRYCMPGCPLNIQIPRILDALNEYLIYNDLGGAKFSYGMATNSAPYPTDKRGKASECIKCGQCNDICTQHIDVMAELEHAAEVLEG